MNTQPLFYRELKQLTQLIAQQAHVTPSHSVQTLIDDYLSHYNIDFVSQGMAAYHTIWKTHISSSNTPSLSVNSHTIVQHYWTPVKPVTQTTDNDVPPAGVFIICHGYFDHTGLYGQLIERLLQKNYCIISFDLPGHGLSSGDRADIDSFDRYRDALHQVIRDVPHIIAQSPFEHSPALPIDVIGQSTGCAVISNYLLTHQRSHLRHCILLAPLVRSHHWRLLRWLYFALKPFISSIPRAFPSSSHNKAFTDFLQYDDPLQSKRVYLQWLGAMEEWYQTINTLPSNRQHSAPLLIIQGMNDNTVDWQYNLPAIKRCFPNSQLTYIPEAKHHLVNETEEYWQQVKAIMDAYLSH